MSGYYVMGRYHSIGWFYKKEEADKCNNELRMRGLDTHVVPDDRAEVEWLEEENE